MMQRALDEVRAEWAPRLGRASVAALEARRARRL